MARIDEVILAVDIFEVDVIIVVPVARPWLVVDKPVTAVVEAAIIAAFDVEMVFAAKAGAEFRFRHTADVGMFLVNVAIGVLFGLFGALLILSAIILVLRGLRGRGLAWIFLFGAVVVLLVNRRLRFCFLRWLGSFPRFFLPFGFFLGFVFVRLLTGKLARLREEVRVWCR